MYSNNRRVVPVFFPRGNQYNNVTSENYWQYCMYFLIRYENWGGNLDYYMYFDIEDTSGIDEHKKTCIGLCMKF